MSVSLKTLMVAALGKMRVAGMHDFGRFPPDKDGLSLMAGVWADAIDRAMAELKDGIYRGCKIAPSAELIHGVANWFIDNRSEFPTARDFAHRVAETFTASIAAMITDQGQLYYVRRDANPDQIEAAKRKQLGASYTAPALTTGEKDVSGLALRFKTIDGGSKRAGMTDKETGR